MNDTLTIYVISSKRNPERLDLLKDNFPRSYNNFEIIDAVLGDEIYSNDYFNAIINTYKTFGRLISPNELGCARSHMLAIENFISSKKKYCLILEDDVIGDDDKLDAVISELFNIKNGDMLICGTQINRINNKYLPIKAGVAKKLNKFERYFVSGAFSYGLTQEAARKIIYNQKKKFSRSDDWTVVAKNIGMYFVDILKHPAGYLESGIEIQRLQIHKKKIDKIKYDGIFLTIKRNVYKVLLVCSRCNLVHKINPRGKLKHKPQ